MLVHAGNVLANGLIVSLNNTLRCSNAANVGVVWRLIADGGSESMPIIIILGKLFYKKWGDKKGKDYSGYESERLRPGHHIVVMILDVFDFVNVIYCISLRYFVIFIFLL